MTIPARDDAGQTAKLDQGRANGERMLGGATSFVLITEDGDGEIVFTAACDGQFMLEASSLMAEAFLERYLNGDA